MELLKSDLFKLGSTVFEVDNYTCFVCKCDGSFMETIIIRECLKLFGDYKIIKEADFYWENDECDWAVYTNFPWAEYMAYKTND